MFSENMVAVVFQSFFYWKCIKIIFFFFKNYFFISAHQNDMKTLKIYQFEAKKE
jgi:hypothetical protein